MPVEVRLLSGWLSDFLSDRITGLSSAPVLTACLFSSCRHKSFSPAMPIFSMSALTISNSSGPSESLYNPMEFQHNRRKLACAGFWPVGHVRLRAPDGTVRPDTELKNAVFRRDMERRVCRNNGWGIGSGYVRSRRRHTGQAAQRNVISPAGKRCCRLDAVYKVWTAAESGNGSATVTNRLD